MTISDFEQFYEVNLPKIYRFFFYKVLNKEVSEDLTSQTFLRFTKEFSQKSIENPRAYLYGIAKFVALDFLRSKYKQNEISLDEDDEAFAVDSDISEIQVLDLLERVLPQIPEKQAIVLRMRFLDKLTLTEIAAKLNKDVNYVSTTQKRAFQSIRDLLACTDAPTNIVG